MSDGSDVTQVEYNSAVQCVKKHCMITKGNQKTVEEQNSCTERIACSYIRRLQREKQYIFNIPACLINMKYVLPC